ncbi:FN3 associated domain-containing protein [Flavihumibacter stibioxidans]|uniref:Cytochrome c domain-containing protein n=1 Tax=Flavihumibacter stibioxidans TaxID=1834163 RepID=A0ABR7MB14_9BACT|nr:FN3 associated domain-containing protein [Flavihumibacter stibioxidans]MBC6492228.1 hypothetical protein [Flavihumibacter stibioxidans]
MRNWKTILFNLVFACNILLLFFALAEYYLVIPSWLQVAGRMHPLVLHFPIAMVVLVVVMELLSVREQSPLANELILLTSFTTGISALMGLLLSREEGYDPDAVAWHKWSGILLSLVMMGWYAARNKLREKREFLFIGSAAALSLLVVTGHQGAGLTHGEDFLFAPVQDNKAKPVVALEDAMVFDHVIKPVLDEKCNSCHNPRKAKGELVMATSAAILKGGKNGVLWDTTAADYGLLLRRLHLPVEDKKHMPPKGKPQLTPEETAILFHWIKSGSPMDKKLADLDPADSLRLLTTHLFQSGADETYTFEAADPGTVQQLNNHYRVVSPVAIGSPALEARFFGAAQFSPVQVEELQKVGPQLISLNLANMPLTNSDLQQILQFARLRYLNLSFTNISDSGLQVLQSLKELRELSLSGTAVTVSGLLKHRLPVKKIFLWNTGVDNSALPELQKAYAGTVIETGYRGDSVSIRLNPPILQNEERIISGPVVLELKHFIKGAEIRYTTDGTEPDSISSPVFKPGMIVDQTMIFKARAFKKGWTGSEAVTRHFLEAGLRPDSLRLLTLPDPQYKGNLAATLFDGVKSDLNFRSGKIIGYKEKAMDLRMNLNQARELHSVTLSGLVDVSSYIMPPTEIQLWGGLAGEEMKLLGSLKPPQPARDTAAYESYYTINFPARKMGALKLVVKQVSSLPKWHRGKGERGWIFLDEIFIQ